MAELDFPRVQMLEKKFLLQKEDLVRALDLIKSQKDRNGHLDRFGHSRKLKILNFCSKDPAMHKRKMSNTQQLLYHLNRSVSKHDWPAVATCIDFLLNMNGKLLPVIWKAIFLVLLNHPLSGPERIDNFLQMCIGLRTNDEKVKYLRDLMTLPRSLSVYNKKRKYLSSELVPDSEDEDDD